MAASEPPQPPGAHLTSLVARALAEPDPDSDLRWEIVQELHGRGDRLTFEVAVALATSPHAAERVLGADILGQFGYRDDRPFAAETLPVLLTAATDADPDVVAAAITGLGHLGDERARAAMLRHLGHPSAQVRFAIAAALPLIAGRPADPAAVAALIDLTRDPDPEVRDWATMGLGSQLDVDTPEVRQALTARLHDPAGDTADEARVGLARRTIASDS
jgi:HEAT repeat protein